MNYQEIRNIASAYSDALVSDHPCRKGNGRCCERDIPVTPEDTQVIFTAVKNKEIPLETLEQAKKNAANPQRDKCPFLSEKNECTIYESRPLICIVTGTSGLPRKPEILDHAIQRFQESGEAIPIQVRDTTTSMCSPCANDLVKKDSKFSFHSMIVMQEAMKHLMRGFIDMPTLVKRIPIKRSSR